jgi:hypothetical protein
MNSLPADILKQISEFVGPSNKPRRGHGRWSHSNGVLTCIEAKHGGVITIYKGDALVKEVAALELELKSNKASCIDHIALHQTCKVVCDTFDRAVYDARDSWAPFGNGPWRVRANRFIYGPRDNVQSSPNHLLWFRAYVKLHGRR